MELWQRKHIINNLPELSELTIFNCNVKAELLANNILCKADVEKLDAEQTLHGNSQASYHCYQLLMGRTTAYKVVVRALMKHNQSGAARILIRVPTELYSKPMTYLDISTKLENFKDLEIQVHGKTFRIHEYFPSANYETLQQIFHDTLTALEIYDTFVTKERPFVLANNTVPPKPPFYVARFLSNRIKVDKSIFEAECSDVFVFKNSIERYKLSQIAKPNFTISSNSVITHLTSRFVYLDEIEDWTRLKELAKVPTHLINYEADKSIFILEDTSVVSTVLMKYCSQQERVYISENEFVHQQLSEARASRVCICDTPGMGKTFLLANIARLMTQKCIGRIITFIPLATFSTNNSSEYPSDIPKHEADLLNLLKYNSHSHEITKLTLNLVKAKLLLVDFFLDGFDEIPADKVKWIKQFFLSITTKFPEISLYISSRPHMRQDLEKSLGVIAYDICPFSRENQVDFLVQFWSQISKPEPIALKNYATSCLDAVKRTLTSNEKEITGIPLLCQLIAENYNYSASKRNHHFPSKLSEMYHKFINKRINLVAKNEKDFKEIKLAHIWHALKLLFRTKNFHKSIQLRNVNHLRISCLILKAGILQKNSKAVWSFMHRTFAEYLATEYFFTIINGHKLENIDGTSYDFTMILKFILEARKCTWRYERYTFVHSVIVSFLESNMGSVNITEKLKNEVAAFCTSISPEELISIMYSCCQENFCNIFSFLITATTKCDIDLIRKSFPMRNTKELLTICIKRANGHMFHCCIELITEVLKLYVEKLHIFDNLIEIAVMWVNYEAVEYLVDRVPLSEHVLQACVEYSDGHDSVVRTRENIVHLLLTKMPSLIHEGYIPILERKNIHVRLIKLLVKLGAKLSTPIAQISRFPVCSTYGNVATKASKYMSPNDYHELIKFCVMDCKAEYLFFDKNAKWIEPLPDIICDAPLLPATLNMLLNIHGIDIHMKDKKGENLLFSAVRGNKLETLQRLVNRGLDYNAKGEWNQNLFHVAAENGGALMIEYLLSLKLDVNCRDKSNQTPLHMAVLRGEKLSVVKILVENGANVNAKDVKNQTALHLSAKHSWDLLSVEDLFQYLIEKGVGVNDRDIDGNTPIQLCTKTKAKEYLIRMSAAVHDDK